MPNETNTVTHGTASLLFLLTLLHANSAQAKVVLTSTALPSPTIPARLAAVRNQLEAGKQFAPTSVGRFGENLHLAAWEDSWVNFNDGAYWEDIWSDFSN
ncbi:hypothetical protein RIF25_08170 [Thermosynechococcaceae cyanobacterium BACA0444]|uniref:Uncharacterized protein n=1 Tax=Pseudocalidococcus azoricus BACA0444 TaxID=2918990 RepID=A0AAE4JYA3_9CYAN|nr:hypothetical protein [Pseudocalidococcus azoricus]MDS3860789.1 hypothetical protein [Pseudocalidococcus azoricus BACA0444]